VKLALIDELKEVDAHLRALRKLVKAEQVQQINKMSIRTQLEKLCLRWFEEVSPQLHGLRFERADFYDTRFTEMLRIAGPGNAKGRHLEELEMTLRTFKEELVLGFQTKIQGQTSQLKTLLGGLSDPIYGEYLEDAIKCADAGVLRGAAILGWSAAIDQVHHSLIQNGIEKFNQRSTWMSSQTKGRFKKFNQIQNIHSLSELREVFDNIILWILEGMEWVDINQHARLHSCFELRCQCSHPGEAPITEYNLLSFFSDLEAIVFSNPTFAITTSPKQI
jgi:hypothetical protein